MSRYLYAGIPKIPESRPTQSPLVAAMLSTVFTFLVISILILISGFMCGLYVSRKFNKSPHVTTERPHQVPVYDYVQMSAANQRGQNLKLKKNVSYLPSKSTAVEMN